MSTKKVDLGEDKALSVLTFEDDGAGKLHLGAVFLIPTRKEGDQTFYQPLGVKAPITAEQREAIVRMLGGVMMKPVTEDPNVKDPDPIV